MDSQSRFHLWCIVDMSCGKPEHLFHVDCSAPLVFYLYGQRFCAPFASVCATLKTWRGTEGERVADPSSPAPRNCSPDAFQPCFIAETVAKKPATQEFNRIAREVKRTQAVQKIKSSVCQLLLLLMTYSLYETKTIYFVPFEPLCSLCRDWYSLN